MICLMWDGLIQDLLAARTNPTVFSNYWFVMLLKVLSFVLLESCIPLGAGSALHVLYIQVQIIAQRRLILNSENEPLNSLSSSGVSYLNSWTWCMKHDKPNTMICTGERYQSSQLSKGCRKLSDSDSYLLTSSQPASQSCQSFFLLPLYNSKIQYQLWQIFLMNSRP